MNVSFVVEGDPVGKGRPKFRRVGEFTQTYTPKKTKDYERLVQYAYIKNAGMKKLHGAIEADIYAYFKVPSSASKATKEKMLNGNIPYTKKIDADNLAKSILDALNSVAYDDDKQVTRLLVVKSYGDIARVVVSLKEIGTENDE